MGMMLTKDGRNAQSVEVLREIPMSCMTNTQIARWRFLRKLGEPAKDESRAAVTRYNANPGIHLASAATYRADPRTAWGRRRMERERAKEVGVSGDRDGNRDTNSPDGQETTMSGATFGFRLAGGGGFTTALGAVRDVLPHKQRGKCIVQVLWGRNHSGAKGHQPVVRDMVAVGDHRKLKSRLEALRGAGSDIKEEGTMNATRVMKRVRADGRLIPYEDMSVPVTQTDMVHVSADGTATPIIKPATADRSKAPSIQRIRARVEKHRKQKVQPKPVVVRTDPPVVEEPTTTEQRLARAREELEVAQEMLAQAEANVSRLEEDLEAEQAAAAEDARKQRLIGLLQGGSTIEEALKAL